MRWRKLRQSRGVVILCSAHWLGSPWCVAEAMLARAGGKAIFTVFADGVAADDNRIPAFLEERQVISLAGKTETEVRDRLLRGLAEEGLSRGFALPDRPYLGLSAFGEKDAAVFFGRNEEIAEVAEVLTRRRRNAKGFILVLGASGCGKSSLVRAGVLPRLPGRAGKGGAGGRSGEAEWVVAPPVMAGEGMEGLVRSLASAYRETGGQKTPDDIRNRLGETNGLCLLRGDLLYAYAAPGAELLIVLDQLEEVVGTAEGSGWRCCAGSAVPDRSLPSSGQPSLHAAQTQVGGNDLEELTLFGAYRRFRINQNLIRARLAIQPRQGDQLGSPRNEGDVVAGRTCCLHGAAPQEIL
jgi:energy-coupling factor transporter ATP-binding protein EcfA2